MTTSVKTPPDSGSPVTVIARHAVDPGKEEIFESWMRGIVDACRRYEGYINSEVIRPVAPSQGEYVCIFRFDVFANLDRWLESDERRRWLEKASEFGSRPPSLEHYHSLEFWFEPRKRVGPSRPKMALVTFSVIWPMVHFIPKGVRSLIPTTGLLAEVVSVATIVVLMTWVVMPVVTRLLEPWLWREKRV